MLGRMVAKLISSFFKPKLTEKNVIKNIHDWQKMVLDRPHFAKEYAGVEILQKRDDLRQSFLDTAEKEMKGIVASNNPHYLFRKKIIKTIKVQAINSILLNKPSETIEKICDAINRGMKYLSDHWNNPNISFERAMMLIKDAEAFSGEQWNYTKIVHEFAWSEVEGLVLRHMQVLLFHEKVSYNDWWNVYRQAYEKYIEEVYQLIGSNADKPEGFPHPLLIAITNDTLTGMVDTILKSVEQ
jgi:hypothetical protein